jgi:hypothetical protein
MDEPEPEPTLTPTSEAPAPAGDELVLAGDAVQGYVDVVSKAIARARLSEQYPPGRRLAAQIEAMGPRVHGGLYAELRVDRRSGLPGYREWARVTTDAELSARVLAELPPEPELQARARREPHGIWGKQWLKHRYHAHLCGIDATPPSHMTVKLRRVDPVERRAWFHVVLDKLDQTGVFVRASIDLAQQSSFWKRPMLELDEDAARETEGLRAIVYRLTSLDAELTLVRLADTPGLQVERVIRGTVGPIFVPGVTMPEALAAELQGPPGPGFAIASFGLDMAAADLASDGDNDPLEDFVGERLPTDARAALLEARRRHGYRVYKDRKLVVAGAAAADAVQRLCTRMGTRNVVYVLRGGGA